MAEAYDPTWLVEMAIEQHADKPWQVKAFRACTATVQRSRKIIHFVEATRANQPGSAWQVAESVWLIDPVAGSLNVDILSGGRVRVVEFYDRLFSGPHGGAVTGA